MSSIIDGIYIHPDATLSVVPHLKAHLPVTATQLYVVEVPPDPVSTVLATFPPSETPPESSAWSIGVIAITGRPETEFWFWSSAEEAPTLGEDADQERFRAAYAQFVQMLKFICRMCPEKGTLAVGSLYTWIASHIPRSSRSYLSPPWIKFAFSKDSLPPQKSSAQGIRSKYFFKSMAAEELDEAVQMSAIRRDKVTLAAASNTGAYTMSSEEKRVQAWCFISREGSISLLYVRPEARRMGLGKETARRELEKEFVHRKFVMADVSPTNFASIRLCQSLGGCRAWEVVWVDILLSQFRQ
jgi:FR47-like protein